MIDSKSLLTASEIKIASPRATLVERLSDDLRNHCASEMEFDVALDLLGTAKFHPQPKSNGIDTMPVGSLWKSSSLAPNGFLVPKYQRGYRWRQEDVELLLNDLKEFLDETLDENSGLTKRPFYCLQPLVVKDAEDSEGWEVVDGQQRLTTIFIILKHLNGRPPFNLSYATREHSKKYLESFDGDPTKNIDFYHISNAHEVVKKWFDDRPEEKGCFQTLFANTEPNGRNVRFIWYELRPEDDPVDVFTRLNEDKIPLTDEELIRALFLRNPKGGKLAEGAFQYRLALEWDRIETTLQDPAFWAFLTKEPGEESGRIRLLFEMCAPKGCTEKDCAEKDHGLFLHYDGLLAKATPEKLREVWQQIVTCFEKLEEWWRDPELFHLVGFLTTVLPGASTGELRSLLKESTKNDTSKSGFRIHLRDKIHRRLIGKKKKSVAVFLAELDYNDSHMTRPIRPTLALFNIATLLRTKGVNLRFPFHSYHANSWDIEHVHSQAGDNLNKREDQLEWLALCEEEISEEQPLSESDKETPVELLLKQIAHFIKGEAATLSFEDLYKPIVEYFEESALREDLHGIGNLTLLDATTNRAYKNAPFAVKRATILKNESKGTFILPCTRDLFLKCYSKRPGNLRRWSAKEDGESHKTAIRLTLEWFFTKEGTTNS